MFTVQRNQHNDIIVCKGDSLEKGYFIVFKGTLAQCNQIANGGDL